MDDAVIRAAKTEDAPALAEIYRWYVENTAISFEWQAPSDEEFAQRIAGITARFPYYVAERDGRPIGYAYAEAFRSRPAYSWSASLSIYVDHDHRREGIGRKLYETLFADLQSRGFTNLYATVCYPIGECPYVTDASCRFHKAMGFTVAGHLHACGSKFGIWYDCLSMEKIIGEHPEQPVLPRFGNPETEH